MLRVGCFMEGLVQGVGFRPFIYKIAYRLSLVGFVKNYVNGVEVEVEGNEANNQIKSGKIVAIKGVGGFHIVCDTANGEVIKKLREYKNRPTKPFAIMCRDIDMVKSLAFVSKKEKELLESKLV